ncbi:two-component sensor histidine kinase [Maritimibacter sp. 55A14]|uniref:ATP-binding protein n=1 Tax=Maritimibacter sp. 55A14 TaxID=2174844 RepID=UPI000D6033DB|nr:ATP-binding protein [Maritimibacter sp. 55A14]PWE33181.1 two-component sensor histidine kinase [Maritimibacter sp. 55A14]
MEFGQIRAVIAQLPQPLLIVGDTDRVLVANQAAAELLGSDPEGRNYVSAIRQPAALDCIGTALRLRRRAEANYLRAGVSSETTYRLLALPVSAAEAGFEGAVVSFEDISHVADAEQMRRDFIANVSHEMRSPLTALTGFIETLQGAARDDPAARDRFLEIMQREAARMNRLVGDLLSLTRVEVDERVRPRAEIDVLGVIRGSIAALRPMAEAAGVRLDVALPEGELRGPGDADQLTQVFHNLIENAVKYGGSGGVVELRATRLDQMAGLRGPALRVDVTDHGEGIDPVHIPRLTERFYRVDSDRSREKGGTGLGLAIVKHIVNRHRGRFQIESETGRGSTFSVIIPVLGAAP